MANLQEGGRRLAAVGLIALKCSAVAAVIGLVGVLLFTYTDLALHFRFFAQPIMLLTLGASFWLGLFGAVLLATGWIVKGFGMPEMSDRSEPAHPSVER